MKKFVISMLVATCCITAWALPVDRTRASSVATTFINSVNGVSHSVRSVESVDGGCYIVNFAPQGWVIVAADDNVEPVIGYSPKGSLSLGAAPDNLRYMFGEYKKLVVTAARSGATQKTWADPVMVRSRAGASVEPLITMKWNQPAPFNKYCPGTDDNKALVGCVAVAIGQAMSVQQYPSRPKGSVSYSAAGYGTQRINFDSERAYNWDDILSGANSYDEVARFLYHAGMSVRMNYGVDGSGIPSNEVDRISNGLREHFGYGNDVSYIWRSAYKGDWDRLVLNELHAGRAVIYNAVDTDRNAGHSFNVDGFDGNNSFHVNWGWGGSGDGYFRLDNLRDAPYFFNDYHVIIIGIGAPDRLLRSITLSNSEIEEGLDAGSVVGSIMVNGEVPAGSMTFSVRGMYNSSTDSYAEVPFTIDNGMLKTTRRLDKSDGTIAVDIEVTDGASGESLVQGFSIAVRPWRSIEEATSLSYNRTIGSFTLKTKHNVYYTITGAAGVKIAEGAIEPLPELTFNKADLSDGVNVLELRCGTEVKKIKIVK